MPSNSARINRFYRSKEWLEARLLKIVAACGRCELCGEIGEEVHHRIHITHTNVYDCEITLNQDNLVLLCKDCHNKEHERFDKNKQKFDKDGNMIG